MEGSSLPKISFMWDSSVNKFKLLTGSAPATAFTFQVNTHLEVRATGTSSSATNIPVFISNPNSSAQTIYTRTPSELKSDIGLGNVENLALSGITFTAGSGLAGGGTLAADRTFNVGQGDGITVSADSIAVDSTVVRTTGTQSIGGAKTFGDGLTVGNNVGNFLAGTSGVRFTHPQINFQIDAGNLNPGFDGDALRLDIDSENGTGYLTTLKSNAPVQNITVRLPDTSGTLALDERNMIAGSGLIGGGDLSANRTFNIGQGDGISVSADAIAVDSTVVRTTGNQSINGVKTFGNTLNVVATGTGNAIATVNIGGLNPQSNVIPGKLTIAKDDGDIGKIELGSVTTNSDAVAVFTNAQIKLANGTNANTTFVISPTGYYDSNISDYTGAVTSGYWRASTIQVDKGGTGKTSYSNGQLLIGSGTGLAANTLTAGSNVQITNGSGTITIAATGLALSSRTLTAGSGLVGGGDLSADRTFNIGQGDGITVSADAIAVDSTVVRTTGTQTINGSKTFGNKTVFQSGIQSNLIDSADGGSISITDNIIIQSSITTIEYNPANGEYGAFYDLDNNRNVLAANSAVSIIATNNSNSGIYFPVWTINPNTSAQAISSRTASQLKGDIGLSNVTNDAQIKKLASTSGGFIPTWNGTTGDALNIGYSVETTLTGGTSAIPRADAVKTYVDNMIGSGIATNDAMIFKGTIDCSTNPNYPAADRGWVYKISVAGRIGGASGPVVEVNDTIICGTDGTAAGTHASVGGNWNILQTNIVDASILVTGPTSATSGNFAMFDGTTGKIVRDSSLNSSSFATANHTHGNITNAGAIGSTANLPIITTTAGALTTGSFGSTANTFCQGNDSRLSDTRNTTNSITVNNGGAGDSSSFTFNGSAARTISYNSIGAPSISGSNATGTWNISVTGNAGTVTNGVYTNGSYADPSWITSLAKSKVGLSNVENTALSTWAGSANLTTLGTVVTGTWNATTIAVDKGGTGQTSYTNGQLLIGNTTGNTLTKATLTQGTAIDITNGGGSITIGHNDTSTLTGAQGSNGIASFTVDGMGHVTAVTTATYLTAGTVCAAIVDCLLDGGTF
jgi:hypothetical protein